MLMPHEFPHGTIRTFTGRAVDPLNLRPEDIDIRDIAHALAMQPRFAGHCRIFYPVASHCIWVSNQLPPELKLFGLLHDASEAYLLDIPTPVKSRIPGYQDAEKQAMQAVAQAFGLPESFWYHPEVKAADKAALQYEWRHYVTGFRAAKGHSSAKYEFLSLFNDAWDALKQPSRTV